MSTTQLRLDTQAQDATLVPSKISTNPTDDFSFPRDVSAAQDLVSGRNVNIPDDGLLNLNTAGSAYLWYDTGNSKLELNSAAVLDLLVNNGSRIASIDIDGVILDDTKKLYLDTGKSVYLWQPDANNYEFTSAGEALSVRINGVYSWQVTETDASGGVGTAPGDWTMYLPQGTPSAPVILMGNSAGLYSGNGNAVDISSNGSDVARFSDAGISLAVDGTGSNPSYTFNTDAGTGMSLDNTGTFAPYLVLSANGQPVVTISEGDLLQVTGAVEDGDTKAFITVKNSTTYGSSESGTVDIVELLDSTDQQTMRMRRNSQGYFEIVNTSQFQDTADVAFYIEQVGNHPIYLRTDGNDVVTVNSDNIQVAGRVETPEVTSALDDTPMFTATGSVDTGMAIVTDPSQEVDFWANGTKVVRISSDNGGLIITDPNDTGTIGIKNEDGSATDPSYSFSNDPNTGIYSSGADQVGISANGIAVADINSSEATFNVDIVVPTDLVAINKYGSTGSMNLQLGPTANTGIYIDQASTHEVFVDGADVINIALATSPILSFGPTGVYVNNDLPVDGAGRFRSRDGLNTAPTYSFLNDPDSGMYRTNADQISIALGGAQKFVFSREDNLAQIRSTAEGSAPFPVYSGTVAPDTGMYFPNTRLGFSVLGDEIVRMIETGLVPGGATTGTFDLGSAALHWKDFYTQTVNNAAGDLILLAGGGNIIQLDPSGDEVRFLGDARPHADNNWDIGIDTEEWKDLWIHNIKHNSVGLPHLTIATTGNNGNIIIDPHGTGHISASGAQVKDVADPTAMQDAATKAYVDSVAAGLDPKASVRLGTLVNVPGYVTGTITIPNNNATYFPNAAAAAVVDGITIAVGNRILVKDQSDPVQNGIYEVVDAGVEGTTDAVLERSSDMDGSPANEISGGNFTFIEFGTQSGQGWTIVWDGDVVLDTDPINWTQFSQQGSGTVNNGIAGRFAFYPVSGNSVDDTTALTTDGTDVTVTNDLRLANDNKVILGNADAAYFSYSPSHNALFGNTNGNDFRLAANEDIHLYANTNAAGDGDFVPAIHIVDDGIIHLETNLGNPNSYIILEAYRGATAGFNSGVEFQFTGSPNQNVRIGYDADGVNTTGTRIQGDNLTVESLSPLNLVATSVDVSSKILNQHGTEALPSYSFAGNTGSGFSLNTAGTPYLAFSIGGTASFYIDDTGFGANTPGVQFFADPGTAAAPGVTFNGANGLFQTSGQVGVSVGGTEVSRFASSGILVSVNGSESNPSIKWTSDANEGLWHTGADSFGMSAQGAEVARIAAGMLQMRNTAVIRLNDGSAGTPAISFTSDTDTGLYRVGSDSLGFSAGAAQTAFFEASRATFVQDVYIAQQANTSNADFFITSRVGTASPAVGGNFTMSAGDYPGSNNTGTATSGTFTITTRGVSNASLAVAQGGSMILTSGGALVNVSGGNAESRGGSITLTSGTVSQTFGSGVSNKTRGGSITLTAGECATSGDDLGGNITLTSFTPTNGGSIIMNGTGAIGTPASPAKGNIYANHISLQLGSAASPAYTFTGDTDTGIYGSTDILNFASGGTERLRLEAARSTFFNVIRSKSGGSAGAPDLEIGSATTGIYNSTGGSALAITVGGSDRLTHNGVQWESFSPFRFTAGSAGVASQSFNNDPDTGLFSPGANIIGFTAGGTERARIDSTGIKTINGSVTSPSYSFTSDTDTGFAINDSFGANAIDIVTGGAAAFTVIREGVTSNYQMFARVPGTALRPVYSEWGSSTTGIFFPSGNVGISVSNSETARFTDTVLDMNNHQIIQVSDPTNDTDAANKRYVDSVAAGLDPKASVRVATLVAGTLASDFENGDSIDGVTLVTGDRILIKNQADPIENGIYTVNASGAPTRSTDMDGSPTNEVSGGNFTFVEAGTQAGTGWVVVWEGNVDVGTDPINWTQFSESTALIAGNGIDISGQTVSVKHDGEGLTFVGTDLTLELDGSSLTKSAAGLKIANAGVVYAHTNIATREVPTGTIDGVNDTFTLAFSAAAGSEHVFVNGLLQNEGAGNDYTISGDTITFNAGAIPQTGSVVLVTYWKA